MTDKCAKSQGVPAFEGRFQPVAVRQVAAIGAKLPFAEMSVVGQVLNSGKHILTSRFSGFDPIRRAPGSWQRIGGESPPRGRFSQPPRPRVMHEVLLARAAVKRSQGRPRAKY